MRGDALSKAMEQKEARVHTDVVHHVIIPMLTCTMTSMGDLKALNLVDKVYFPPPMLRERVMVNVVRQAMNAWNTLAWKIVGRSGIQGVKRAVQRMHSEVQRMGGYEHTLGTIDSVLEAIERASEAHPVQGSRWDEILRPLFATAQVLNIRMDAATMGHVSAAFLLWLDKVKHRISGYEDARDKAREWEREYYPFSEYATATFARQMLLYIGRDAEAIVAHELNIWSRLSRRYRHNPDTAIMASCVIRDVPHSSGGRGKLSVATAGWKPSL